VGHAARRGESGEGMGRVGSPVASRLRNVDEAGAGRRSARASGTGARPPLPSLAPRGRARCRELGRATANQLRVPTAIRWSAQVATKLTATNPTAARSARRDVEAPPGREDVEEAREQDVERDRRDEEEEPAHDERPVGPAREPAGRPPAPPEPRPPLRGDSTRRGGAAEPAPGFPRANQCAHGCAGGVRARSWSS
jgi:hypothetical protein